METKSSPLLQSFAKCALQVGQSLRGQWTRAQRQAMAAKLKVFASFWPTDREALAVVRAVANFAS
jgi:hypothetical protein